MHHRPKRCQFKVVYNIPTPASPSSSQADSDQPSGTQPKQEMTANPTSCPSAALKVAGDCPHCSRVFCSKHRMPESHSW